MENREIKNVFQEKNSIEKIGSKFQVTGDIDEISLPELQVDPKQITSEYLKDLSDEKLHELLIALRKLERPLDRARNTIFKELKRRDTAFLSLEGTSKLDLPKLKTIGDDFLANLTPEQLKQISASLRGVGLDDKIPSSAELPIFNPDEEFKNPKIIKYPSQEDDITYPTRKK